MPNISAIITTFNRATFLKKAIWSILNQTYQDFELLILDNSSSDETEKVVKSFTDKKIRYIKHKPLNISQARNLGIKEAKGEYIAFLDDDDEWLPNKLKDQIQVFEDSQFKNLALVYGKFIRIDEKDMPISIHNPYLKGDVFEQYLKREDVITGSASNPLMKKSILQKIGGYNDKLTCSEDWELYLRLAEKYSFDFTKNPVLKIRTHSKYRLGGRTLDALKTEIFVYERYEKELEKFPKTESFYLQAIGGKFCRINQIKTGRKYLRKAIRKNPLNYLAYLQYSLSFLGTDFYQRIHKFYKNAIRLLSFKNSH